MNGSAVSRRHLIAGALASAELPSMIKAARKPDRSKPNVACLMAPVSNFPTCSLDGKVQAGTEVSNCGFKVAVKELALAMTRW